jgi:putative chitinase
VASAILLYNSLLRINMSQITADNLVAAGLTDAATAAKVSDSLATACERFEISEPQQIAMFLAQAAHESGKFKATSENLNYSKEGLHGTWPKRFPTVADAEPYHRQPEKIANKVYADRMGNGDEASGDGFKYRGRGFIQLTGKSNYQSFSNAINRPEIMDNPDLVAEPELAALSAAWFWNEHKLNAIASDVTAVTKKINGGTLGLADRSAHYTQALGVFA